MLGDQIRKLRMANKLSQVQLANKMGVSKQSISNWEHNIMIPSIAALRNLCKVFSCSADYLLELEEGKPFIIDVSRLTVEQAVHIQQLVDDIAVLNAKGDIKDE